MNVMSLAIITSVVIIPKVKWGTEITQDITEWEGSFLIDFNSCHPNIIDSMKHQY